MSRDAYEAAKNLVQMGLSNEAFRMGVLLTSDERELAALADMWPVLAEETGNFMADDALAGDDGQSEESTKEA